MVLFERSNAKMDRYAIADGPRIMDAECAIRSWIWFTYGRGIDVNCLP